MQVTHVQDHVTHAVIGGKEAMSFGMSDSAEFFNILSNTLYSDKPQAVVREVLCNAWDSHIQSGRTRLPVVVTLDDKRLVIRDHGTGIAKQDMQQVYCVYGNSTKKNDGKQTGGFGLGCKAPFAYTDHFEVISFNGGQKTIYRISKSSGEVGGRPGMMEIVSVPSDEHGLQVTIDLKSAQDRWKFEELIGRIASVGEMNVTLNGVKVTTVPFSKAKNAFLITDVSVASSGSSFIYVRYGNVVYPVPIHESYANPYHDALELLGKLDYRLHGRGWKLILLAEPHTISVTPSRESLSMTDFTIETICSLLENFHRLKDQQLKSETFRVVEEGVRQHITAMKPARLLDVGQVVPTLTERHQLSGFMADFRQISLAYVGKTYPTFDRFRERDITTRLKALIESGFGNRGLTQTFLATYLKNTKYRQPQTDWFHRRLVAPLVMGLRQDPNLSPTRLMVYGRDESPKENRRFSYSQFSFVEATKFHKEKLLNYLPFLRNLVILTHNRDDVENRAPIFAAMQQWFGSVGENLVYVVQRSDPKVEAARAFFKARGFYVLDLTKRAAWEPTPVRNDVEKRDYKPRKKGIPQLSALIREGTTRVSTDLIQAEDVKRIEDPEFVVKIAARNNFDHFDGFNSEVSTDIVKLFGDKGGIVVNESQRLKFISQGAEDIRKWMLPRVMDEIKTNPRIQKYLEVDLEQLKHKGGLVAHIDFDDEYLLGIVLRDQYLRAHFNVDHALTDDDARYILIWRWIAAKESRNPPKEIKDFMIYLSKLKVSEELIALTRQVQRSHLKDLISKTTIDSRLKSKKTDEATRLKQTKARDLLIWAIKG